LILLTFSFGCDNISQAVTDFYKYDKITNIERVFPENVTFPAITVCTDGVYWKDQYKNGSLIKRERVLTSLLKYFLSFERTDFYSFKIDSNLNVRNHLDTFNFNDPYRLFYDCIRFNAIINKSVELFKVSSIEDVFKIVLKNFHRENISGN